MSKIFSVLIAIFVIAIIYSNLDIIYPLKYQNVKSIPHLNVTDFFAGEVEGWGILVDWNSKVKNRFRLEIIGQINSGQGNIVAKTTFDNGRANELTWSITIDDDHKFKIFSDKIAQTAYGTQYGNAASFKYKASAQVKNKWHDLTIEHTMYLVNHDSLIMVTRIKKYGIVVNKAISALKKKNG